MPDSRLHGDSPRSSRRGFILIAVLVIVASALLVTTTLLFLTQAELASAANTFDHAQSRALATSGLNAITAQLNDQRHLILEGSLPRLDEQYTIYESGGRLGVIRLLPVTPAGDVFAAESAKLDLNQITVDQLISTSLVDSETAAAIVKHRDGLPNQRYESIFDLLAVPGVTPAVLLGPIEDLKIERPRADADIRERVLARLSGSTPRGLADLVTVFSFEPAIQRNSKRRINLNVPWSDELAELVQERFGTEARDILKRIFDSGTKFDTESRLVEVLRFFQVPLDQWPDLLDTFTTDSEAFHAGRVNLNAASYEVIAALPTITPEQASQIVQIRDEVAADRRATIAWPAIENIIPSENLQQLAGLVTTRSFTFHVRLAAGELPSDDPDAPLEHPIILDAVIDLAAPRARIAYLRDVTLLQTTATLAAHATLSGSARTQPAADDVAETVALPDTTTLPNTDSSADDDAEATEEPAPQPSTDPPSNVTPPPSNAPSPSASPSAIRRTGRWLKSP